MSPSCNPARDCCSDGPQHPTNPLPVNDPVLQSIAQRIRAIVAQEPAHTLDVLAATLHTQPYAFRRLVEDREGAIDPALLIDVVTAFVREFAIDPQWLLTGTYDSGVHSRALVLGEDRSEYGVRAIQEFVREQYRKLLER